MDPVGGRSVTFPCQPAPSVTSEEGGFWTSCWSALEWFVWMRPTGWVVHKRAFVTLGHNSLSSACLGMSHKGIVQSAPIGGRGVPQSLRAVGQRPGNPTPAVAGRRRGVFSHISRCRHLRDLWDQQPAGLALPGLPAGSGRHPGCGVHRPHRAALAGHQWATCTTCNGVLT